MSFSPYIARGRSAWRARGTTDRLFRTANVPVRTSFTICGLAMRTSHAGAYASLAGIGQASSSPTDAYELAWGSDGLFELNSYAGAGTANDFTTNYGDNAPFFFAMVGGASSIVAYARGPSAPMQTVTGTTVNFTAASLWVGDNGWGEAGNFRLYNLKVWDRALDAVEVMEESLSMPPVSTRALNGWWPLEGHLSQLVLDRSGYGRSFTTAGAARVEPWFFPHSVLTPLPRKSAVQAAAAAGVTYPQLERGIRGLNRGLALGSFH